MMKPEDRTATSQWLETSGSERARVQKPPDYRPAGLCLFLSHWSHCLTAPDYYRAGNPTNRLNAHESPCRSIRSSTSASTQKPHAGASAGKPRAAMRLRSPRVQQEPARPFAAANADHGHRVVPLPRGLQNPSASRSIANPWLAAHEHRVAVADRRAALLPRAHVRHAPDRVLLRQRFEFVRHAAAAVVAAPALRCRAADRACRGCRAAPRRSPAPTSRPRRRSSHPRESGRRRPRRASRRRSPPGARSRYSAASPSAICTQLRMLDGRRGREADAAPDRLLIARRQQVAGDGSHRLPTGTHPRARLAGRERGESRGTCRSPSPRGTRGRRPGHRPSRSSAAHRADDRPASVALPSRRLAKNAQARRRRDQQQKRGQFADTHGEPPRCGN